MLINSNSQEQRGRGENCREEEEDRGALDQAEQPPDLKITRGASVAAIGPFPLIILVFQEECGRQHHKAKRLQAAAFSRGGELVCSRFPPAAASVPPLPVGCGVVVTAMVVGRRGC